MEENCLPRDTIARCVLNTSTQGKSLKIRIPSLNRVYTREIIINSNPCSVSMLLKNKEVFQANIILSRTNLIVHAIES